MPISFDAAAFFFKARVPDYSLPPPRWHPEQSSGSRAVDGRKLPTARFAEATLRFLRFALGGRAAGRVPAAVLAPSTSTLPTVCSEADHEQSMADRSMANGIGEAGTTAFFACLIVCVCVCWERNLVRVGFGLYSFFLEFLAVVRGESCLGIWAT